MSINPLLFVVNVISRHLPKGGPLRFVNLCSSGAGRSELTRLDRWRSETDLTDLLNLYSTRIFVSKP